MKKLGDIIKEYRIEHSLSLREFSDICHISHSYIDKLEKGIDPRNGKPVIPTLDIIEKLSRALGITIIDLLEQIGYIQSSILNQYNTSVLEIEDLPINKIELEQQIDEIMALQNLALNGKILDDEDKDFIRTTLKAGLKYAADVRKKQDKRETPLVL